MSRKPRISKVAQARINKWQAWGGSRLAEIEKLKSISAEEFPVDPMEFLLSLAPPGYRAMREHPKEIAHANAAPFYILQPKYTVKGLPEGCLYIAVSGREMSRYGYVEERELVMPDTHKYYQTAWEWHKRISVGATYVTDAQNAVRAVVNAIVDGDKYTPAALYKLLPLSASLLPPLSGNDHAPKRVSRMRDTREANTAAELRRYWLSEGDLRLAKPTMELMPLLDQTLREALLKASILPAPRPRPTRDKNKIYIDITI